MTVSPLGVAHSLTPHDATTQDTTGGAAAAGSSSSGGGNQVTQDQFLQLLVTQLKNQDPMNPTNSDQFMSELAQFSQLQETIGIHQDLNSLLDNTGIPLPGSGGN